MNKYLKRILGPLIVVGVGVFVFHGNEELAVPDLVSEVNAVPVKLKPLVKETRYSIIEGSGKLEPLSKSDISSLLPGEVVWVHPDLKKGNIIPKGEAIFRINCDDYEVAAMNATSNVESAQLAFEEEKARGVVVMKESQSLERENNNDLYLRKPHLKAAEARFYAAEAESIMSRVNIGRCITKVPYDAVIHSVDLGVGQYVVPGSVLVKVSDASVGQLRFTVSDYDEAFLASRSFSKVHDVVVRFNGSVIREAGARFELLRDEVTRLGVMVLELSDPYSIYRNEPPVMFGSYLGVEIEGIKLESVYPVRRSLLESSSVWVADENLESKKVSVEVVRHEGNQSFVRGELDGYQLILNRKRTFTEGAKLMVLEDGDE